MLITINLGKWWGPWDQQPIVAIHGWQDNAATFDRLIELLPSNVAVLAIDLPGHGLSSHLPTGLHYYIFWDGLIALRRVIKYYKWNKVSKQKKVIQRSSAVLIFIVCEIQLLLSFANVSFVW